MRRNSENVLELLALLIGPSGIRPGLLLGDEMRVMQVPTLFLVGERDGFMTRGMARAWASIADENGLVEVREVPAAGHLPWIDEPERVVAEVQRFLATPSG